MCILMKKKPLEVSHDSVQGFNGVGVIAKHVQTSHVPKQKTQEQEQSPKQIRFAFQTAKQANSKQYNKWWILVVNNKSHGRKDQTSPREHPPRQPCNSASAAQWNNPTVPNSHKLAEASSKRDIKSSRRVPSPICHVKSRGRGEMFFCIFLRELGKST